MKKEIVIQKIDRIIKKYKKLGFYEWRVHPLTLPPDSLWAVVVYFQKDFECKYVAFPLDSERQMNAVVKKVNLTLNL